MLLSAGVDPEVTNNEGKSALDIAKEDPICYSRIYKIKYLEQAIQQKRENQISSLRDRIHKDNDSCVTKGASHTTIIPQQDFTPDM